MCWFIGDPFTVERWAASGEPVRGRRPTGAKKKIELEVGSARLEPIGIVRSTLKKLREAPRQGSEGAPDAWLELRPSVAKGLDRMSVGDNIIVITWLHRARRDVLKVRPRGDMRRPLAGVFTTRSPDRPNPLGLHRVTVHEVAGSRFRVGPIEALDGTPVVDIKPVLDREGS